MAPKKAAAAKIPDAKAAAAKIPDAKAPLTLDEATKIASKKTQVAPARGAEVMAFLRAGAAKVGGACLSASLGSQSGKLQWRCAAGHVWGEKASNVLAGKWCLACSIDRPHPTPKEHFDKLLGVKLHPHRGVAAFARKNMIECPNGHVWSVDDQGLRRRTMFEPPARWCDVCHADGSASVLEAAMIETTKQARDVVRLTISYLHYGNLVYINMTRPRAAPTQADFTAAAIWATQMRDADALGAMRPILSRSGLDGRPVLGAAIDSIDKDGKQNDFIPIIMRVCGVKMARVCATCGNCQCDEDANKMARHETACPETGSDLYAA